MFIQSLEKGIHYHVKTYGSFSFCATIDIGDKCETKINQNVQKKTNLKTSLNNLEKIE